MFRILCDPASGTIKLYLTENIRSVSQMFVLCLVGIWQRNFEPVVCVYGPSDRTHTHHWFKIVNCKICKFFSKYLHFTTFSNVILRVSVL